MATQVSNAGGSSQLKNISWSTASDDQIVAAVEALDAGETTAKALGWEVGQKRSVTLSGTGISTQTVQFALMNKGGFTLTNGEQCNFVVGMTMCLAERMNMNSSSTNYGSWESCDLRTFCNGTFRNAIPSSIRSIFKQFTVITGTYQQGSGVSGGAIQETTDYFTLPAEKEVFGESLYSTANEANQLRQFAYYSNASTRDKTYCWWERSPSYSNDGSFCCVARYGSQYQCSASGGAGTTWYGGTSPFGCI